MTLADIKNSIFKKTATTVTQFSAADMVIGMNNAYERVNSIIRKYLDNYRPTLWTTSDLSTGTAEPKFDSLFHDLIALWPSYEYAADKVMPNANQLFMQIQIKEKDLALFYGCRNYHVFTVTIASPGVVTKNDHRLLSNDRISLITTGALPTGLSADTFYFVIVLTDHTFRLSATRDGTAINTSSSQSGTHYYMSERRVRIIPSSDSNK